MSSLHPVFGQDRLKKVAIFSAPLVFFDACTDLPPGFSYVHFHKNKESCIHLVCPSVVLEIRKCLCNLSLRIENYFDIVFIQNPANRFYRVFKITLFIFFFMFFNGRFNVSKAGNFVF